MVMDHPVDFGHAQVGKGYWLCIAGLDGCFGKASDDGEFFEEVIVDWYIMCEDFGKTVNHFFTVWW